MIMLKEVREFLIQKGKAMTVQELLGNKHISTTMICKEKHPWY